MDNQQVRRWKDTRNVYSGGQTVFLTSMWSSCWTGEVMCLGTGFERKNKAVYQGKISQGSRRMRELPVVTQTTSPRPGSLLSMLPRCLILPASHRNYAPCNIECRMGSLINKSIYSAANRLTVYLGNVCLRIGFTQSKC